MSLVVVVPPVTLVDAAAAKTAAPVFARDDDARVNALLAAAQAAIEPPSGLKTAFGEQTLELRLSCFGSQFEIDLPSGPVSQIVSVKYDDVTGSEQTIETSDYDLLNAGSILAHLGRKGRQAWPRSNIGGNAVRIQYKAGKPANDPSLAAVKMAVILGAVQLRSLGSRDLMLQSVEVPGVDVRRWVVSDAAANLICRTVSDLLSGHQVYRV